MTPPSDELMTSAEVMQFLGIDHNKLAKLNAERQWPRVPGTQRRLLYYRADIEAELASRAATPEKFRQAGSERVRAPSPKDLAITERCAERIRQYWADRGQKVFVETFDGEIFSDTRNGLPVK